MSGGSAPKPGDPVLQANAQAAAQTQLNRQQTRANRPVNQTTPWGSQTWNVVKYADEHAAPVNTFQKQALVSTQGLKGKALKQAQRQNQQIKKSNKAGMQPYKKELAAYNKKAAAFNAKHADDWTSTTTLDPELQKTLDIQQKLGLKGAELADKMSPELESLIGTPLDMNGVPDWKALNYDELGAMPTLDYSSLGAMPKADDATRQRVEDAMYQRMQSRLDPKFNEEQRQLQDRLTRMGFSPGSAVAGQATGDFMRNRNDAYQTAMNESILTGGNEMQRQFELGMQGRQQGQNELDRIFGSKVQTRGMRKQELDDLVVAQNAQRAGMIGERGQLRDRRMQELMRAMGLGGPISMPQMPGIGGMQQGVQSNLGDLQNQAFQADLANYNADQAATSGYVSAGVGAAASIGGALIIA